MPMLPGRPRFQARDAVEIARDHFGFSGSASALPSDRDQNFLLVQDDQRRVLKIANAHESRATLELQHQALHALESAGCRAARPYQSLEGQTLVEIGDPAHLVRLMSWLPGRPLAEVRDRPDSLWFELGEELGRFDRTLARIPAPKHAEPFDWNLLEAARPVERALPLLPAGEEHRRQLLSTALERAAGVLDGLPRQLIQNDANDWNVLIARKNGEPRLGGILDLGDLCVSVRAAEPAVAIAYAMFDAPDPLHVAGRIVAGFHAECPLTEAELAAVFELARLRLAVSVSMSTHQRRLEPDNEYLSISEDQAWNALEATAGIEPGLATAALRDACGLEPCPRAPAVRTALAAARGTFAPVLDGFDAAAADVLDLSVGNPHDRPEDEPGDLEPLTARTADYTAGRRQALGRWLEPRLVYTADGFAAPSGERRTVHLGVDMFAPAGTSVCAPLEGTVHSVADNHLPLDYGPTVILRHELDGTPFYTLYGHLERASVADLQSGDAIARGQAFARLGAEHENGGWPPHVHLQVIADVLGRSGDYPGVAEPSRKRVWASLCPDPSDLIARDVAMEEPELLEPRRNMLGRGLSLSYREPLHMVRGRGAHLYDFDGRRFVDLVNNVCHVGHCHPHVVAAARSQIGVLNTNTRYLHRNIIAFAEKLLATFPDPLSVVFFVNSGSEANDLALRIARAHTQRRRFMCLEGGYHGNLGSLIDISPYKHDRSGGEGTPDYVTKTVMPDPYRGRFRGPDSGAAYARCVADAMTDDTAAFVCESLLGCGGQIVLPEGYLAASYEAVRSRGGVTIADEVQVGFGRVGRAYWGFELQDVVPDIVTLGKPIGNGHPLGAVITTPELAASFDNGMEYFNTFGGNPVSCAIGEAVLDVIDSEGLQEQARLNGDNLRKGLQELQSRHEIIGDVRGEGLFVGVELIDDDGSPAAHAAKAIVERMRRRGFLLSTDGPDNNVIKIKPPLVISDADLRAMVCTMGDVLASLY